MSITTEMLEFLACPQCRGKLHYTKEEVLLCPPCRLCFSIEDGIPQLSLNQAMALNKDGSVLAKKEAAHFRVISGPDTGVEFYIHPLTCKVIGRRIDDASQTQVYNADFTMNFDDKTKKIIANYLSGSKPKSKIKSAEPEVNNDLGAFKRLPDLIMEDQSVSRLHAMIFYDETSVGVLDLVSRNGTFLNGKEIEAARVANADEITIGQNNILMEIGQN